MSGRPSLRRSVAFAAASSVLAAGVVGVGCTAQPSPPDAPASGASSAATALPPSDCASCHMPEYRHADHPVHVNVKPTTCAVCHSQESWHPSVLHHEWWPLTGAHEKAECKYCHTGTPAVFEGTPKACVGCHRKDYDGSKFPGHSTFPTTCADCHSTVAWKPATRKPTEPATAPTAHDAETTPAKPLPVAPPIPHPTARPVVPVPPVPTPRPTPTPVPDVTTHSSPRR